MATSSRLCSDEELQKARQDLKELIARRRAAEGFKDDPGHVEEGSREEGREKEDKVGKKKKMYVLSKEEVEMVLNRQCAPLHDNASIHKMAQEDEETYGDLRTLVTVAGVLTKRYHDRVRSAQEKLRHEIETKGYYAYEATDDDVMRWRMEMSRRYRPGIVKHARGVEKLK